MKQNCSRYDAGERDVTFIDIGLLPQDVHTGQTSKPTEAALSAFLDFLLLMDAKIIVRTKSSFSGTVCRIRSMDCVPITGARVYERLGAELHICTPTSCTGPPV